MLPLAFLGSQSILGIQSVDGCALPTLGRVGGARWVLVHRCGHLLLRRRERHCRCTLGVVRRAHIVATTCPRVVMCPHGACCASTSPRGAFLIELPARHELVHFMLSDATSFDRVLLLAELLIACAARAYGLRCRDLILPLNDLVESVRILC